jgi:hypothetical protein
MTRRKPATLITSLLLVLCVLLVLSVPLAGCSQRQAPDIEPMPMFHLEAHEGQQIQISGLKSLRAYYPVNPDAYRDHASEKWASVAQSVLGMGIMGLTSWGTVYTMGKTMRQIAPLFGDGNLTLQPNNFSGQQDIRLASPDSTHPAQVVDPVVVTD